MVFDPRKDAGAEGDLGRQEHEARQRTVKNFNGMENKSPDGSYLNTPRVVSNAVPVGSGVLMKRPGKTKLFDVENPHSIWASSESVIFAGQGKLWRYDKRTKEVTDIYTITGPDNSRWYFCEFAGWLFATSAANESVVFDSAFSYITWDHVKPERPLVAVVPDGTLPPGDYRITFTKVLPDGTVGPRGEITKVSLETTGGIELLVIPPNHVPWATATNGDVFYRVSGTSIQNNQQDPLKTVKASPFIFTPENICSAHDRLWGKKDDLLLYSEVMVPWYSSPTNFFQMEEPIILLAPTKNGMVIGTASQILFLEGKTPETMSLKVVYPEGVSGERYCHVKFFYDIGTDVLIITGKRGLLAVGPDGRVVELTQDKILLGDLAKAAIASMSVYGEDGVVLTGRPNGGGGSSTNAAFSDMATVDVYRNGKLILA